MSESATTSTEPATQSCSGCACMKNMLTQNYRRAVEWENPLFSAGVVAAVYVAFLTFWSLELSLLSLVCYAAGLIVIAGYVIKMVKGDIFGGASVEIVSRETSEKCLNIAYERVNQAASKAREIFLWTDWKQSAVAVLGLFVIGWLSGRISAASAIFIAVNFFLLKKPGVDAYNKYAAPHVRPYLTKACGYVESAACSIPSVDRLVKKSKKM